MVPIGIRGFAALLLSVQLFGDVTMGAKRWLDLGIVTVQPSEFIRLGMILARTFLPINPSRCCIAFSKSFCACADHSGAGYADY